MNNDELILAELRKISGWIDFQRKVARWLLGFTGFSVIALIITSAWAEHAVQQSVAPTNEPEWYKVTENARAGKFDEAIRMGELLVQKTPLAPEAHHSLGDVYLAAGKLDKAREHYAEAYRLFPSEQNEKLLGVIDQRIKSDGAKP